MMPEIINTHDQIVAAGGGVAILTAYAPGISRRASGWSVYRVNADGKAIVTDSNAPFYAHGRKEFYYHNKETKEAALEEAKAWILKKYGEAGPWKRNAMRDYVPERIAKQFPLRKRPKT